MNAKSKPNESYVLAIALDKLKKQLNLSSDDLAKIIGVHRNTVSRILNKGEIVPKNKRILFTQKDFWVNQVFPSPAT